MATAYGPTNPVNYGTGITGSYSDRNSSGGRNVGGYGRIQGNVRNDGIFQTPTYNSRPPTQAVHSGQAGSSAAGNNSGYNYSGSNNGFSPNFAGSQSRGYIPTSQDTYKGYRQ